jgi:hypothetical protein
MSFRNLILALTFLAIFVMGLRPSIDTDTWWQLRTGELIAQQRAIPTTDSFSFTRDGRNWRYPSTAWLMELSIFMIYRSFGAGGLNIWMAAMITLAFAFIYMAMSGGGFLRVFVLVLATTVSAVYWAARPYMATFVLSAAFLWILEDFRWDPSPLSPLPQSRRGVPHKKNPRRNKLIFLPILMMLWVNSHPGFALGFILVGIYLLDELIRTISANWPLKKIKFRKLLRGRLGNLFLIAIAMLLAACLSPAGLTIFSYPFETVSIGVLRDYIQEWQSPNFHQLAAQPFIWLLLFTLLFIGVARKRIAFSDFLLISVSVYLTLLAGRNMPLFALVAPIVLTRYAKPVIDEIRKKFKWRTKPAKASRWQSTLNVVIVLVIGLVVILRAWMIYPNSINEADYATKTPVSAVDYIKEHQLAGNLFNSYNWGGYLIWNLREYPVFVDGRTDLYSDDLLTEWLNTVSASDGWRETLEKWNIGLVLIEPSWPLAKLLPAEGWQLLFEDQYSVLYIKPQ